MTTSETVKGSFNSYVATYKQELRLVFYQDLREVYNKRKLQTMYS